MAAVNPHLRILFPLIFRESGREGEKKRRCERGTWLVASRRHRDSGRVDPAPQLGALAWDPNLRPSGRAGALTAEPPARAVGIVLIKMFIFH